MSCINNRYQLYENYYTEQKLTRALPDNLCKTLKDLSCADINRLDKAVRNDIRRRKLNELRNK